MALARRFIILEAFGILLVLVGYFMNLSLTLFIIYNCLCILLLVVDFMITPGKGIFQLERSGIEKLSIFEEQAISITVLNTSDLSFKVEIKDDVPEMDFDVPSPVVKKIIGPHRREEFKYIVIPQKRGAYKFSNIYVRYSSRLGFLKKHFRCAIDVEYKVYPNLMGLRKYHLAACNSKKYISGMKKLKAIGNGTSFESLREYIPGDEYRRINWQATARESRPIVNQYEPEKDQHVYAAIDSGRPMSYTVQGKSKLDLAVNTALVLSDIVNQNGDKSGLLTFNTDIQTYITPGKGPGHRNKIMEALYHIESTNYTSDYEGAFFHIKKNEKHRSIIFLFTDFDSSEEAEEMLKTLHLISKGNTVIIVLIKNEMLENIACEKTFSEEGFFNRAVAMEQLNERKKIISILNRSGIMCMECEPESIEMNTVSKYIQSKNRMHF